MTTESTTNVMRVKIVGDQPADPADAIGRAHVGYKEGLSTAEIWERGRGVWRAKLANVAEATHLLIAHRGVIVGIGTIDGLRFFRPRVAIEGTPFERHPLLGQPDPLDNSSQNPVTFGKIQID